MFTNYGKKQTALRIGSDAVEPFYCAVGTGSSAPAVGDNTLVTESTRTGYSSLDFSTAYKFKGVWDFPASALSGLSIKELGVFDQATASTGSLWNHEGFTGVAFDGTNDLRTQVTYRVY